MPRDLHQLLHDTAVEPDRTPDVDHLVQRGHRRRRIRHGATALGSAAALVAVVAIGAKVAGEPPTPQIMDTPPADLVAARIGVLDTPAGPDDQLPEWVTEELEIDPDAAATARLARRTPGRTFYVYADDTPTGPQELPGPAVCVAVVDDVGQEAVQTACGPRHVPSRRHAPTVLMSDFGTVGIAPDGITRAREVADGDELPDVPVVNNLFIDPAAPGGSALEGRSDDAFCAVAPMRSADPESLVDSDDPMGLLAQMAATAPAEIADDMYLVWDYLRLNPDAIQTNTIAFPGHVEHAANRVDEHIRTACGGEPTPDPTTASESESLRSQE